MNERIFELAEQAHEEAYRVMGSTCLQEAFDDFYTEKFAELIIQECVKLCEHESNDDEYDQYDMGMSVKAEDIKASIMKTFGVK